MRHRNGASAGFTLPELGVVLAVVGLTLAIAAPRVMALQHRLAAQGGASLLTRALLDARHVAVRRSMRTAVHVDTAAGIVTLAAGPDTLAVHDLHELFGVSLTATRDSIAYTATGLGYGASNARFLVVRGSAVESVTVSRLGRVRR
jgi:prepilin-type N-terminal cleavage/methylation domain-containing protein